MPQRSSLGIVNADHLSVAIPYPGLFCVFVFSPVPFPRPQVYPGRDRRDRRPRIHERPVRIAHLQGDEVSARHRLGGGRRLGSGPPRRRVLRGGRPDRLLRRHGSATSRSRRSRSSSTARRSRSSACTSSSPRIAGAATAWPCGNTRSPRRAAARSASTASSRSRKTTGARDSPRLSQHSLSRHARRRCADRRPRRSAVALRVRRVARYDRAFFPEERDAFLRCWIAQPGAKAHGGRARRCDRRLRRDPRRAATGYKVGPALRRRREPRRSAVPCVLRCVFPPAPTIYPRRAGAERVGVALAERHGMSPVFETARMYAGAAPSAAAANALRRDDVRAGLACSKTLRRVGVR